MNKRVLSISLLIVLAVTLFGRINPSQAVTYQPTSGPARGYLVTPTELVAIRNAAAQGVEPHRSNVNRLLTDAGSPGTWAFGTVAGNFVAANAQCYSTTYPDGFRFFSANDGGHQVYRKMLAYYLSGNIGYAQSAREKILDLTDTVDFGGENYSGSNQCLLELAFSIPVWIQAADLLEGTSVWSRTDKQQFQNWLATQVYKKVAWASRTRANNWGNAGSLTASMIGDYLWDSGLFLGEAAPAALTLTPGDAYVQHNEMQRRRMNGVFRGDAQCSLSGIQAYGGIPEELRRGTTGCNGLWIFEADKSLSYQTTAVEFLVFHAEYLLRRGDSSLYDSHYLLSAIKFVIANPSGYSMDWVDYKKGSLFVAYHFYYDVTLYNSAATLTTFKGGGTLPYAPLTHALIMSRVIVPTAAAPLGSLGSMGSPTYTQPLTNVVVNIPTSVVITAEPTTIVTTPAPVVINPITPDPTTIITTPAPTEIAPVTPEPTTLVTTPAPVVVIPVTPVPTEVTPDPTQVAVIVTPVPTTPVPVVMIGQPITVTPTLTDCKVIPGKATSTPNNPHFQCFTRTPQPPPTRP